MSDAIDFDVMWRYLQENRLWYTCAGHVLDTIGRLSVFGDDSEETAATLESLMRALEDDDGSFVARWKKRFRENPAGTDDAWKRHIEPMLIRTWMAQAKLKTYGATE